MLKNYSKSFTWIDTFNHCSKPMIYDVLLYTFYKFGNWGQQSIGSLLEITHVVSEHTHVKTKYYASIQNKGIWLQNLRS